MQQRTQYWFPVKRAGSGWGWGLPIAWQGWLALGLFLAAATTGSIALLAHGQLALLGYNGALMLLLVGLMLWKGEPQSMRHRR